MPRTFAGGSVPTDVGFPWVLSLDRPSPQWPSRIGEHERPRRISNFLTIYILAMALGLVMDALFFGPQGHIVHRWY